MGTAVKWDTGWNSKIRDVSNKAASPPEETAVGFGSPLKHSHGPLTLRRAKFFMPAGKVYFTVLPEISTKPAPVPSITGVHGSAKVALPGQASKEAKARDELGNQRAAYENCSNDEHCRVGKVQLP